jgi:hypothetical protein
LTVLSSDPVTKNIPFGENATEFTKSSWKPSKTWFLVILFQHLTLLSLEPDTIKIPSNENATELTYCSCLPNSKLF